MNQCLICGAPHKEIVGENLLVLYVRSASRLLLQNLLKRQELHNLPNPLCASCGKQFALFMQKRGHLLIAEFLVYMAERAARNFKIQAGIESARREGKQIGRPKKRDDAKIHELRARGLSIRRIAKELSLARSCVGNSLAGVSTTAVMRSLNAKQVEEGRRLIQGLKENMRATTHKTEDIYDAEYEKAMDLMDGKTPSPHALTREG